VHHRHFFALTQVEAAAKSQLLPLPAHQTSPCVWLVLNLPFHYSDQQTLQKLQRCTHNLKDDQIYKKISVTLKRLVPVTAHNTGGHFLL
jgi:hypothetical protein